MDTKLSLKRCENILTNILTRLEISNVSQKEDNYSASDILDDFPIKDSEMLQKVEHRLKTDESYKNSVVREIIISYIYYNIYLLCMNLSESIIQYNIGCNINANLYVMTFLNVILIITFFLLDKNLEFGGRQ